MKNIAHYSGDQSGGAGRAAARISNALNLTSEYRSEIFNGQGNNWHGKIENVKFAHLNHMADYFRRKIDAIPKIFKYFEKNIPRSTGFMGKINASNINSENSDLVHLHWINGSLISIEEIGKIRKPLVWTLHDMWPFCGAEHLAEDSVHARWRNGYIANCENIGFDIDRWVWNRKVKSWKSPIEIVAPSNWLGNCARESRLMRNFPITVIPHPLDINLYIPKDKNSARLQLNLPLDRKLILFGAIKGTQLAYKGWDLMLPALFELSHRTPNADVVIFGESEPKRKLDIPMKTHWMGHIKNEDKLASLYSAADVMVIPSRQESFGQTGSEAQACGCPVVAFNATGLMDVVEHMVTGILATPYNSIELAAGIELILKNENIQSNFSHKARDRAKRLWSYDVIANKYISVYNKLI